MLSLPTLIENMLGIFPSDRHHGPFFIFQLCIRSFNLQSFKHFVLLSKRSTDFQVPSKRNDIRLLTQ